MSNTQDNNRRKADETNLLNIEIIVDEDVNYVANEQRLREACTAALSLRHFDQGEIGIRVTTDLAIHQINRDHLGHDYPTDVISFSYSATPPRIEGELVVSVDTATERANDLGWSLEHELLLYVIHGTLHITGMDDHKPEDRLAMRGAERQVMLQLGIHNIDQYAADGETSPDVASLSTPSKLSPDGTSQLDIQHLPEDLS